MESGAALDNSVQGSSYIHRDVVYLRCAFETKDQTSGRTQELRRNALEGNKTRNYGNERPGSCIAGCSLQCRHSNRGRLGGNVRLDKPTGL